MDKRVRVVQLFYTFDVEAGGGGLSRFAIELGKTLDPKHFEVILCSLGYYSTSSGRKRIDQLNAQGLRAFEATEWDEDKPYHSFFRSVQSLQTRFADHSIDILHSHSEFTDIAAILLKLQRRAPKILRTVHYGYRYEWATKPLRRAILTNFLYPILFDTEIGINQFNTDRLNRRWIARLLRKRAVRIFNAIPLERFANVQVDISEKKRRLGIPPDAPVVGTVGRLTEQKGYRYLVEAAAEVLKILPQTFFLIVGDGHLVDELKDQAGQLGIASNVIFTGARTDIEELLLCMDLFVSSSLWEGLPTVILEAMACNLPVIATDIPGTNELIHDGVNGKLVPPENTCALSDAILEIIGSSHAHRVNMVRQAIDNLEGFSIHSIARTHEVLYQSIASR